MRVRIFEVGPRDGLQNEKLKISLQAKKRFVKELLSAGAEDLELGAFVRGDRVPQMADTERLYASLRPGKKKWRAWALVPNLRGLERARKSGVKHIAVFTASSDAFVRKNIGMSLKNSLKEFEGLIREARSYGMQVRGYVSTAFGCPYSGRMTAKSALDVTEKLLLFGAKQVSICDTIGVATPRDVIKVIRPALRNFGVQKVAVHYHDTRGTALTNAVQSLELGVRVFDASAGGLGGCPYAPGASGNLATEDLVYLFEGMGIQTGLDLDSLCRTSTWMAKVLRRPITSKYVQATLCRSAVAKKAGW